MALYRDGLSVAELGRWFGIYSRTAAAHLVRRSVPLRQRGLATEDVPEAIRLYESGLTLGEVGLRFGISQGLCERQWPRRASRFAPEVAALNSQSEITAPTGATTVQRPHLSVKSGV